MTVTKPPPSVFHTPYAEERADLLYNLLFCDNLAAFSADAHGRGPWAALRADSPDRDALRRIAADRGGDSRFRALAFHRLRDAGETVPARELLGVVVEVPQDHGLDVLAAFADGGVRYLNQSSKIVFFEGRGHPAEAAALDLVALAQDIVDRIGPWDQARLPPPALGHVRLSFVVSDGLYFGEAPFDAFWNDALAGPVLRKATELLRQAVDNALS
ncbi:MAG: hypothetical protein BGP24_07385 [Lysobacterales bacterium 69-70]|nr:hypothetical protein [Xanthomonadaceae bacterium]ODU31607.1 MAG: hypothetical protein ABS97_19340 [Xanthomonadaceae bacterium SCN 69-320]ODV17361.1 MAG: hypothetical protein ABT27_17460 [Xanthomonadaceae bacterium SCN 69-25]OJY97793.1 MAG: hypothetical protein BGP24_07385 [Xanthomonadales bacterium 69-70]